MTKKRYSILKVSLWVTIINVVILGVGLMALYFVKIPNAAYDMKVFSIGRYSLRGALSIVWLSIFYYFALNIYYRLAVDKKGWTRWLGWTFVLLLASFVYSVIYDLTIKKEELKIALDISIKIFSYSMGCVFNLGTALLIVAITKQLDEKRWQAANQKVLEQRTSTLEKEKMQADYLFLKAQINPHFLHNTLNFLYARSLPYSTELSEGILTLSEIMRYSLNKEEDAEGKVLLTREIEHVNNIIRIQQLRFGNALQLIFEIRGELEGLRILPFVLITIAENAFKHGELKDPELPVRMELTVTGGEHLHFLVTNKKKTGPKELSTGIGLDNTRKRLELAYGENYSMYIKDQRELYTVDLNITL
jgi:sensor histidine kinase YesM